MVRGWAAAAVTPHACCAPSMSWNAEVCPGSAWRSWAGKSVPTSRCTGRGEKVEPLPEWKGWRPRVVLLKPSFGVSTPDAYRRWSGSRELPGIPYGEQDVDGHVLVNDLERPVFEKHLFLAEVKGCAAP